jgi:uncharacterized protein YcaQ
MTASDLVLDIAAARLLAIRAQGLDAQRPASTDGLMDIFRTLRVVQLDPISAVAKSHQHVLRTRTAHASVEALNRDLEQVLWRDRSLFEYWAHCASMVLTEDFPIHAHYMHQHRTFSGSSVWYARMRSWIEENKRLRDRILREIKKRGPLSSTDIEDESESAWRSSGWTNGRTVSRMLDFLWFGGQLMVSGRKGNGRVWDLAERHLPADTPRHKLDDKALTRQAALHALRALGIGTEAHIKQHFTRGRYPDLNRQLLALKRAGEIVSAQVKDLPGTWYAPAEALDQLERIDPRDTLRALPTRMLSPFDNLICDRKRTEQLFGMEFRIEIYVPVDKRKFGYYVLPVLHHGRFIGRVDPSLDRKTRVLSAPRVHLEPGAPKDARRVIRNELDALAAWVGATRVVTRTAQP